MIKASRLSLLGAGLCLLMLPAAGQSNYLTTYNFTTFAGLPGAGSTDGVGSAALFNSPSGIAADASGNVFVVDSGNDTIRKITPAGAVTTIAGLAGNAGNADGPGNVARFNFAATILVCPDPYSTTPVYNGIAADNAGNLYVADSGNYSVRKIMPMGTNWVVSTIESNQIYCPSGIAVDGEGDVYFTYAFVPTIQELTPMGTNWVASTFASLEGGNFFHIAIGCNSIVVDTNDNVYVSAFYNSIVKIAQNGDQSTVASLVGFGIALDKAGNIYVADGKSDDYINTTTNADTVLIIDTNKVVTTFVGSSRTPGFANGTATNAQFSNPRGVAVDGAGNVYVTDTDNNLIRKITPVGVVGTMAGAVSVGAADGSGSEARFNDPIGIAVDASGNLYVADTGNHTIRAITSDGVVNTLGGLAGNPGWADGIGSEARFNYPESVAVDGGGIIYVADSGNNTIRGITPDGVVNTLAGDPTHTVTIFGNQYLGGFSDGAGTNALFFDPSSIALDSSSNIYVVDQGNFAIRKMSFNGAQWVVSTVVSNNFFNAVSGQDFSGVSFDPSGQATGIALNSGGDFFVLDTTPIPTDWPNPSEAILGGTITTPALEVTSNYSVGFSSTSQNTVLPALPDVQCANGAFYHPVGVTADPSNNIFVADPYSSQIFEITPAGIVNTIGGSLGFIGSVAGAGTNALFNAPSGIAVDGAGNLYVADSYNNAIRKATPTQYSSLIQSATQAGTSFTFTWGATPNLMYQIQYTTNLAQPNWIPIGSAFAATNSIMATSEPLGANAQQFYRVVLLH